MSRQKNIANDEAEDVADNNNITEPTEEEVKEVSNSKSGLIDKQYPDNYVGFRFDPNPDKENLI